jgi:hypothetical protein
MKEPKKESMIKLKNILAENMLRFGVKNLSESDKQHLTEAGLLGTGTITIYIEYTKDKNGLIRFMPAVQGGSKCKFEIEGLVDNSTPETKKKPILANWMPNAGLTRLYIGTNASAGSFRFTEIVPILSTDDSGGQVYQIGYKGDVGITSSDLIAMKLIMKDGTTFPTVAANITKGILTMGTNGTPPVTLSMQVVSTLNGAVNHRCVAIIKGVYVAPTTTAPK